MRYQDSEWMALPLRDRPSFYDLAKDDLIELSPIEADGHPIGRDPREIPKEVLADISVSSRAVQATAVSSGRSVSTVAVIRNPRSENVRCWHARSRPGKPVRQPWQPFKRRVQPEMRLLNAFAATFL
jgi:hypothetical protein